MKTYFTLAFLTITSWASANTPDILSQEDVLTYKKMFAYQRALKQNEVEALKPTLQNKILLGHVEAELLLHPNTKSSYENLSSWLEHYDDLPQATIISKLAQSRSPDAMLTALIQESTAAHYEDPDETNLPKGKTEPIIQDPQTKQEILDNLKALLKQKDYLETYAILQKPYARKLLGDTLWADEATNLGRYLLNQGHFEAAEKLGLIAANFKSKHQLKALWQSAFASYRLNNTDQALKTLRTLVQTAHPDTSHYARAAFWLGRLNQEQGREDTARYYFRMSAENATDFYGQLAQTQLDGSSRKNPLWTPKENPEDLKILMSYDAAQRAIALSQIGEYGLAQKELKSLRKNLPYNMDETLLAVSLERNLPNASFTFGYNLKQKGKLSLPGLYPVPDAWLENAELHNTNPALLFAVMRQESAFDPSIVSRVGARGLMQIMPATSKYILEKMDKPEISSYRLNQPRISIDLGSYYLNYLQSNLNDNLMHVIAAYNGGIGNVRKWQERDHLKNADALIFIESIPFTETRNYTKKVFANYWIYQRQLGQPTPTKLALANGHHPILIASK